MRGRGREVGSGEDTGTRNSRAADMNLTRAEDCAAACGDPELVAWVQFLLEGVGIPLVGGLGLLGNIAAVVVLRCLKIFKKRPLY